MTPGSSGRVRSRRIWWNGRWYRLRMRLLHRLNLCWMQPTPLRDGDNGQWINVWCHWCGVRGKRLDMDRANVYDTTKMLRGTDV